MADNGARGRFLWYDTLTTDIDGAIAFYTSVVGWETQTWNALGTPYQMWAVGDRAVGGLMKMPPGDPNPPHWLGYIGTPDVDATTSRASALGARVLLKPTEIPTVGKYSIMCDPQGAEFAAFAPESQMPPATAGPQVGDFTWHELATTDIDAAFSFYAELFGWVKKNAMDMGPAGLYQEYGIGADTLGGMYLKPKDMPGTASFMFYARVADLDAAAGRVTRNGGKVFMGPNEVPGGDRVVGFFDPQGAAFALHWKKG